jgi:hypothetical protein
MTNNMCHQVKEPHTRNDINVKDVTQTETKDKELASGEETTRMELGERKATKLG